MYHWKVWTWENGKKGIEYSDKVAAPIFIEDRLDETMDSGQITLEAMPIATKNAFPPKTKFRIERYVIADFSDTPRKWDFVVEHDDVEEYAGCPEICCHRIHLIEVSVIAQGMHVDNIALTYELQDVSLNYRTIKDDTTKIGKATKAYPGGYAQAIRLSEKTGFGQYPNGSISYFRNSYSYVWDDASLNSIRGQLLNVSAEQTHHIIFTVPKLICKGCYSSGSWADLFEMNTVTRVHKIKIFNGQQVSDTVIATLYSGATSLPIVNDAVFYSNGTTAAFRAIIDWSRRDGYINEFERANNWTNHPVVATASSTYSNKTISFTTEQLSTRDVQAGYKILYKIESIANPTNSNGMIEFYEKKQVGLSVPYFVPPNITGYNLYSDATTTENIQESAPSVTVVASFNATDMSTNAIGGEFLTRGVKYSCFDLLRRALLTIDTQIIDNSQIGLDSMLSENLYEIGIQYPIVIAPEWSSRLKTAIMQETIFEGKNLWELLLQIGHYLHAIPYLEFAIDGTDRFILKFKQLGATKVNADTNIKITIFNSKNLAEFFTQYDSYVTNLFSPQNTVEEWIVPKTSSMSYLISNDTAELQTAKPILELVEIKVTYDGSAGGISGTESILQYVFEESIYQILTSDNPTRIRPAKGNALFFKMTDNKIQGLNYVPPQAHAGTFSYALQEICRRVFGSGGETAFVPENLKYNSLSFYIKYRTQDSLRLSQIRPDIQNFVKNSSYEKYPHHEQYYGQPDKIIDSERFSANLFGRLIRVGNSIYQRQEYCLIGNEKESGDLVMLNNEVYYVTAVENEYYADAVFQKVAYSKNFNQLSNIVTIPSEPRFYEVSERSKIRREVRLMDFFMITTAYDMSAKSPRYLSNSNWKTFIKRLIFCRETKPQTDNTPLNPVYPNFAYVKYMADYKRQHTGSYGQVVPHNQLFPSSEISRADPNNVIPKPPMDYADCIVPVLHFPLHDGIVFEWDMEDNFKVGDFVDVGLSGGSSVNKSYYAQQPYRYVDVMGRADLFTFKLFYKDDWTQMQKQALPKAVVVPIDNECQAYLPSPYSIGLDKDNREELSFNYQLNFLHNTNERGGEFITFSNLFGQKDSPLKMCFLNEPQSMFNENLNLISANIVDDNVLFELHDDQNSIEIRIVEKNNVNKDKVKSIALYQEDEIGGRYTYIVKNVDKLPDDDKLQSWWIYSVFNT